MNIFVIFFVLFFFCRGMICFSFFFSLWIFFFILFVVRLLLLLLSEFEFIYFLNKKKFINKWTDDRSVYSWWKGIPSKPKKNLKLSFLVYFNCRIQSRISTNKYKLCNAWLTIALNAKFCPFCGKFFMICLWKVL